MTARRWLRDAALRRIRHVLLRLAARLMPRSTAQRVGRRVLVVKPDHLGDVLLLTPALLKLRQSLPDAQITLLIGPWSAAAMRGNLSVDTLLFCPFPGFTRRPKASLLEPYRVLLRTALLLRTGHYDVALIARDDHWWGGLLAGLAGIPRRIGHAVPDVAPLLTDRLPFDPVEHVTVQ